MSKREAAMTETEFQAACEAVLQQHGLRYHHCTDCRRCTGQTGFPDLFIAGRSGVLAAELKAGDNELSPGQRMWRWTLKAAGIPFEAYWPADLGRFSHDALALTQRAA